MYRNMNKVCLYGTVATEPHFGTVEKNGMKYCTIMMTVDRGFGSDKIVYVPVIMFGDMAEAGARTIAYNQKLGVEGRLGTSSFGGQERLSVVATKLDLPDYQSMVAEEIIEHFRKYKEDNK